MNLNQHHDRPMLQQTLVDPPATLSEAHLKHEAEPTEAHDGRWSCRSRLQGQAGWACVQATGLLAAVTLACYS